MHCVQPGDGQEPGGSLQFFFFFEKKSGAISRFVSFAIV